MKTLFLTLCTVAALSISTFAGPDHIEIGQFFTRSGERVSAIYEVERDQYTQVYLVMPDGRKIQIAVEKGTKPAVLDRSLQHIVDTQ